MSALKHPMSGAVYTLMDDGLIEVNDNGKIGYFHNDGRYERGDLKHADLHLLGWLGGQQTAAAANRHAAGHLKKD